MTSRTSELTLQTANDLLKEVGLRRTIARTHLLQCLASQPTPRTQMEVSDLLAAHGFDASTIFRGLNDLVEAGLVNRIDVGDRIWRFEYRNDGPEGVGDRERHPHIVCTRCGRIDCLSPGLIRTVDDSLAEWAIEDVVFKGCCKTCREHRLTPFP